MKTRGFTLIELVVTIALIAIMMSLAVPSFVNFQRNSQLTSTANSFIAAMAAARAEAMKSSRDAYVFPNDSAHNSDSTCTSAWRCGWFVFVDASPKNGAYDKTTERQIVLQEAPPATITTPANPGVSQFSDSTGQYILFNGSGYPRTALGTIRTTQAIDFSNGGSNIYGAATRRVVLTATGRMRVCTPASASDPACVASDN